MLAVKARDVVDAAVESQRCHDTSFDASPVQARQSSGQSGVHEGDCIVGAVADRGGGCREELGLGVDLSVNFKTDAALPSTFRVIFVDSDPDRTLVRADGRQGLDFARGRTTCKKGYKHDLDCNEFQAFVLRLLRMRKH